MFCSILSNLSCLVYLVDLVFNYSIFVHKYSKNFTEIILNYKNIIEFKVFLLHISKVKVYFFCCIDTVYILKYRIIFYVEICFP